MVFIVVLPSIGVLVYLTLNHAGMAERRTRETQVTQKQFDDYARKAAGTGGPATEIEKTKQLSDSVLG